MNVNVINQAHGSNWTLYNGDSVTAMAGLPENSIDFTIHSPPFSNLYIYSDSEADMGNCKDDLEFFEHYKFIIRELYRVTVPGRLCAVHCKDLPAFRNRDGAMGLRDFPGDVIRAFEESTGDPANRWQYHSRVTIWKDPVVERERTNNHGLLHKNYLANAEVVRQGMPDYLLLFRKWSDDMAEAGKPVVHDPETRFEQYVGTEPPAAWEYREGKRSAKEKYSIAVWQRYASPVWFDINQMNVLNYKQAKDPDDEKHICPLQLDVIERAIDLWSNPGDVVFTPFAGIGSEVYQAVKMGRRGIGIELKESYFRSAVSHCRDAEFTVNQPTLFDLLPEKVQA